MAMEIQRLACARCLPGHILYESKTNSDSRVERLDYLRPKPKAGVNGGSPPPPSDLGMNRDGLKTVGSVYSLSSDIALSKISVLILT